MILIFLFWWLRLQSSQVDKKKNWFLVDQINGKDLWSLIITMWSFFLALYSSFSSVYEETIKKKKRKKEKHMFTMRTLGSLCLKDTFHKDHLEFGVWSLESHSIGRELFFWLIVFVCGSPKKKQKSFKSLLISYNNYWWLFYFKVLFMENCFQFGFS